MDDVALVLALAAGDHVALEVFDRERAPGVREASARFGRDDDFVGAISEQTRGKLDYDGRARLLSWIQVVVREALAAAAQLGSLTATVIGTASRMPAELAIRAFFDRVAAARRRVIVQWSLPVPEHRALAEQLKRANMIP